MFTCYHLICFMGKSFLYFLLTNFPVFLSLKYVERNNLALVTLFAGIGSLILSLFVLAVVFVYYYGIKRSLQNKQSNRTRYYCTNCNHAFIGPKPYCEECGIQLNCDRNMYKCRCCGQTFIGKRKICPHCKGKLYY